MGNSPSLNNTVFHVGGKGIADITNCEIIGHMRSYMASGGSQVSAHTLTVAESSSGSYVGYAAEAALTVRCQSGNISKQLLMKK